MLKSLATRYAVRRENKFKMAMYVEVAGYAVRGTQRKWIQEGDICLSSWLRGTRYADK